jgi:protoheme IX farnesyltransferase
MGASALNHYYDRDIDKMMERTAKRPIPAGRLSGRSVLAYGIAISFISVAIAWFTLNPVATGMIALGIFFYVIVYTAWLKRNNAQTSSLVALQEAPLQWQAGPLLQAQSTCWVFW